ncbi:MAG: threonine--tRNA ligase [Acidaminococcaceae bacterium]|uniref:threonine--tRNA ligase n=1 Tax=Succiniclasticum sp. TaxID=2775030 RepID=UPI001B2BA102|nr:threonine--tRNA ligase [Succiniclasticum sp.]MBO5636041.1 threonine--tRNA ligase [Acidaminococcaceae bacterium]MBP3812245.1 threonine--tRNA ligase [Acidaminococcaceae bacterium]MBR1495213.1 threonine--tRNA ligase [Acidaminococcaceae bacterium]MBR1660776.1 threonine--tRNA ligase [Acidaminococcaceae bacterium]MDY6291311.1 threonine--tRNA ligase [Succiniclasticum sp.]
MADVKVTLKDGSVKEFAAGTSYLEIAKSLNQKLGKQALLAVVDGVNKDLSDTIEKDATVEFVTPDTKEGLHAIRHTASHVMAQAITHLFPGVKFAIGPAIDNGFYYDMDSEHVFTPEDLREIEKEMAKIVKQNLPLVRSEVPRKDALARFAAEKEIYKVELINDLPEDAVISLYTQGDFTDLCAGPHCPSTGRVKAFKLMSIAGAYWRGNEKNKMLQRIYGTAFPSKEELDEYLHMLEEAEKRDHRKLGKELDIFSMHDEGPGFPFFHPNGMRIRNAIMEYWHQVHRKYHYEQVMTPMIMNRDLWIRSGHWDHYRENMYFTKIDDMDYAIKPMNCPGGMLVYNSHPHSYKELPLRYAELGLVHRHELSGALHGLFRVRCFTQDDAHIFMTPEQIQPEITNVIKLFNEVYSTFGLKYHAELSTRPENSMGDDASWELATEGLRKALEANHLDYIINEGDGAFYGPKIDFHLQDSIGRTWQCGTIQLDMQLPEKFNCEYTGEDGLKHRPIMIHRVVYGSIERFIGILIEHFAGSFPVWMAPNQVRVMPITDKQLDYAKEVNDKLFELGYRTQLDDRSEKIGKKIREAQVQKVPFMLIVGEKEVESRTVAVRQRHGGDLGAMSLDDFIARMQKDIDEKVND